MSGKLVLVFLAACLCTAYAGYTGLGLGYAAAPAVHYAAAPAVHYAAAAPAVHYAAAAPAVAVAAPAVHYAAPAVLYDNTHYSYGYLGPYGNGFVSAARTGPIASHSYKFHA